MAGAVRGVVVMVASVVILLGAPGLAPAEVIPPCIDYSHREEAGRVEVDLRFDPRTGGFTTLSMWWFIDDPGAAPGLYYWNHLVNGRATTAPNIVDKDDQLHTALKMIDRHTGLNWRWGDTYTFQAVHYSPETRTSYVAAYNRCRITPRI